MSKKRYPIRYADNSAGAGSTCRVCRKKIEWLTKVVYKGAGKWIHASCAKPSKRRVKNRSTSAGKPTSFAENKRQVEADETFRSQKPSTWTRKSRPAP